MAEYHDITKAEAVAIPDQTGVRLSATRQEGGNNTSGFSGNLTVQQAETLGMALIAAAAEAKRAERIAARSDVYEAAKAEVVRTGRRVEELKERQYREDHSTGHSMATENDLYNAKTDLSMAQLAVKAAAAELARESAR